MPKTLDKSYVFAERLCECYKKKRDKNGNRITQAKLAEVLGVGNDTVNAWCNGSLPSPTNLIALANYLECDVDYLLGRIDYVTHENKFISEKTGLTPDAIMSIKQIEHSKVQPFLGADFTEIDILNYIIESENFSAVLKAVEKYIRIKGNMLIPRSDSDIPKRFLVEHKINDKIFLEEDTGSFNDARKLLEHYGFVSVAHQNAAPMMMRNATSEFEKIVENIYFKIRTTHKNSE
ncbi:MAG: helix-turn-helix transcriptional regulator [Ruminococcaceae bacterium]|nr:helix-turn-helix transcriptional regulator [Oscillospiraceae bacterium]